jgi:hypothetical protein
MYQPELLYTTEEHGCSMTTFFNRVEQHEPTILIVKTATEDVKKNALNSLSFFRSRHFVF